MIKIITKRQLYKLTKVPWCLFLFFKKEKGKVIVYNIQSWPQEDYITISLVFIVNFKNILIQKPTNKLYAELFPIILLPTN